MLIRIIAGLGLGVALGLAWAGEASAQNYSYRYYGPGPGIYAPPPPPPPYGYYPAPPPLPRAYDPYAYADPVPPEYGYGYPQRWIYAPQPPAYRPPAYRQPGVRVPLPVQKPQHSAAYQPPQRSAVSCSKGEAIVTGYGFGRVSPTSCEGKIFSYSALREGKRYEVRVSAATGEITEVRKLP